MSTLGGTYSTGTVTVTEDSATVPGAGVTWWDVVEGDWLWCNGVTVPIASVNAGLDEITLMTPWPGATAAGAAHIVIRMSWNRYEPAELQSYFRTVAAQLSAAGIFLYVGGAAPNDADGEEGQWALKSNASPWKLWLKTGGTWVLQGSIGAREILVANRTYYVRADGNNGNSGLANTSGGAFLTLQKAYDTLVGLDLNGHTVTIQVADGTYTSALSIASPWTGGGEVVIQGNTGSPANVVLNCAANCFDITATLPGKVTIRGFKLLSSGGGQTGINHAGVGTVQFANIDFAACGSWHIAAASTGARLVAIGNYTISGGAGGHVIALNFAAVQITGATVTLTGTPAFGAAFAYITRAGMLIAEVVTFVGAATGARYSIDTGSVIYTGGGGANYFPGNSAGNGGTTSGGGFYG